MFIPKPNSNPSDRNSKKEGEENAKSQIRSKLSTSKPTTVEVRGVQVHFPFKPYKCQEDYMGVVIDALNKSENALLESPTGTGKTLCLLCSTLAWQQSRLLGDPQTIPTMDNETSSSTMTSSQQIPPQRVPVIIYASRTHSQLSQVVKELRFTRYRPKHAVLGSREQMCIHPKVKTAKATSSDINYKCTILSKDRKCRFRNNLDGFVTQDSSVGEAFGIQPVFDIEELVQLGNKRNVCPFYLTRGQIADANIIFVPYNYLFDKDARESTLADVPWENSIIIFDEAHNLESFASESASFDLSAVDIAGCINEIMRAIGYMKAMPELADASVKEDNLIKLKSIFLQLEHYLDNEIPPGGGSFTGEYIFEVFSKGAHVNFSNHTFLLKFVKQVSDMMMEIKGGNASAATSSGTPQLDHFVSCVKRIFSNATEGQCIAKARAYRVHVSPKAAKSNSISHGAKSGSGGFVGGKSSSADGSGRVLSYWCFAPALAMHELASLKVRSILVTSGTLSPLASYGLELGLPFPHCLENSHIIEDDQILVRVISKGVSGKELTSTFNRRDDTEYIMELGNTIISLTRVIPGGVLIFFPSYSVMEECIEKWGGPLSSKSKFQPNSKASFFQARPSKSNHSSAPGSNKYCFPHRIIDGGQVGTTPWQRMMAIKSIVLEPKSTSDLKDVIDEFDKFISSPKSAGCILMGVCRGKISEGIDFADDKCRAVIVTGLPFAPYFDAKVKLKREYLDGVKSAMTATPSSEGGFAIGNNDLKSLPPVALSGAEWYSQQAHRAVNQAIGRVIRHRNDYGAILFLDSRFSEPRHQQGVSKWIRPSFDNTIGDGVGHSIKPLVSFFRNAAEKAAANKSLMEKLADEYHKPVLKYEVDSDGKFDNYNPTSESISRIAIVSRPNESGSMEDYIPPNQIIKHVELNDEKSPRPQLSINADLVANKKQDGNHNQFGLDSIYETAKKRESSTQSIRPLTSRSKTDISSTIRSAWSGLRPVHAPKILSTASDPNGEKAIKDKSKELAKAFFELASKSLNEQDFSEVKKLLMEMKSSGDMNNQDDYMRSTNNMVNLLLKYDTKRKNIEEESVGILMLDHLYLLLPVVHRNNVSKLISKARYHNSLLKNMIQKLLENRSTSSEDFEILNVSVPLLFAELEKSRRNGALRMDNSQMNDFRAIVSILHRYGVSNNDDIFQAIYHLIPAAFYGTAQLIVHEIQDKHKVLQTLESQRQKKLTLMDSLDGKPIRNPYAKKRSVDVHASSDNVFSGTVVDSASSASIQKRLKNVSDVASQFKPDEHNLSTAQGLDPVERYLLEAKNGTYRSKESNIVRINRKLDSNQSDETSCTLCGNIVKSLLMAKECNHFFCLNCWTSWFQRSLTCPKCRVETSLDSLSRVVFEEKTGSSFTQICASDDESEGDDELVILK